MGEHFGRTRSILRQWLSTRQARKDSLRRLRRACIEVLEQRTLLAATPYISEFLALNTISPPDPEGDPDWIEIANPSPRKLNLDGYYLTDDPDNLTRWRFPSVEVPGGGYLLVLATGQDITTGPQLHTNFSLDDAGEYLALVAPDGQSVLSEFAGEYPRQKQDVSYGFIPNVDATPLILPQANAKAFVPADDRLQADWLLPGFGDGNWKAGTMGVGFDTALAPPRTSGFTVRMVDVTGTLGDIATASRILDGPLPGGFSVQADTWRDDLVINHGPGGSFGGDLALPNGQGTGDTFVLRAAADVLIPPGTWTIDVDSDDGFMLRIPGVSFVARYNEDTLNVPGPIPADTLLFSKTRGHAHTTASFTVDGTEPLATRLVLDYYDSTGSNDLELSIASGQQSFNTSFVLLGDGVLPGWSVKTASSAPPPSYNPLIGLPLGQEMLNHNASAYLRVPLGMVENPEDFDALRLRVRYDDGFVAYLNGAEIARRNAPDDPRWDSAAAGEHPDRSAMVYEEITVALDPGLLQAGAGTNVLAIHGLNQSAGDDDFLIDAQLDGLHIVGMVQRYFSRPTPGTANDTSSLAEVVADTRFNVDRGFYTQPFLLDITTATPEAEIRYTLDGSTPTPTNGMVYDPANPIVISTTTVVRAMAHKPGALASNVDTQSYLFLEDVIEQPINPPGVPPIGSSGVHWDYEMDGEVVFGGAYRDEIIDDLRSIPTLSLVMNPADMFGSSGIYMNPGGTGVSWERPASMELINPDGSTAFQIDAGLRIYGGVNRATWFPKHSFRVRFKDIYGAGKLHYPFFGPDATDEFDGFVLRGHFNNSWPFANDAAQRSRAQYIHDRWMSETQLAMGQPATHGSFVHLYINGLYWGLYSPTERPDAAFLSSYLGGEKEDYDALNSSEPVDGDKVAWTTLQNLAAAGVTTPEKYAEIQNYLDVDNLIDYLILNFYAGNQDWDDHNWYAGRARQEGAGFQFFAWDGERTLENLAHNKTGVGQADKPSFLYKALKANPEFVLAFADQAYKHFFHGGVLSPEVAAERYGQLAGLIEKAVVAESARWGDFARTTPYTRDVEWVAQRDWELNTYFPARTNAVLGQFRTAGLYPSIDPPDFQHGGEIGPGFELSMVSGADEVYYTLDGTDPRLPGGEVSSSARLYTGPIPLAGSVTVKARARTGTTWSALHQATFQYGLAHLRVSEIMYNPAGEAQTAQLYEFIELANVGDSELDLSDVRFTNGIDYSFNVLDPAQRRLAAGARIVLVRDQDAFAQRYPGVPVLGVYGGALDNAGERLVLTGPAGTLLDFDYSDGWFDLTDGQGYSLAVIDPQAAPADYGKKSNWRVANPLYGGPGLDEVGFNPDSMVINEVMSNPALAEDDWIELYNNAPSPIDISGWFLSNDPNDLMRWRIPDRPAIQPGQFVVFAQRAFGFDISPLGSRLYLSSKDTPTTLGGYRESIDFAGAAVEVPFGRYVKSTGGKDITAMSAPTRGQPNALPLVGPVVITELMYHPFATTDPEFIEIYNITASEVSLAGWRFSEGVDYAFGPTDVLVPFGYGLLIPLGVDPALFRSAYGVPAAVPIWQYYGDLENENGENVKLVRPGVPVNGITPDITIDQVHYGEDDPWPEAADGDGPALARRSPTAYGNDAGNWTASPAGGTPGAALVLPSAPFDLRAASLAIDFIRLTWSAAASAADGFNIERSLDGINFTPVGVAPPGSRSYDDHGLSPGTFYTYRIAAFNGMGDSSFSNAISAATWSVQVVDLAIIHDEWRFNQQGVDLGTDWRQRTYDDMVPGWDSGSALFYAQNQNPPHDLPADKNTLLSLRLSGAANNLTTYYFRRQFPWSINPGSNLVWLRLQSVVDDGYVAYINGSEIYRNAVPTNSTKTLTSLSSAGTTATATLANHGYKRGEIVTISGATPAAYNGTFLITSNATNTFTYTMLSAPGAAASGTLRALRSDFGTYSNRGVGDAAYEGPHPVSGSSLVIGPDNVLAVEVHQTNYNSSDIVWGGTLQAGIGTPTAAAQVLDLSPGAITLLFSEPVSGLDLGDLRLARNDGENLLTTAQTLSSPDGGTTWILGNLAPLTWLAGQYTLCLTANGSGIAGALPGHFLGADVFATFQVSRTSLPSTPQNDAYYLRLNGADLEIFTTPVPSGAPAYIGTLADLPALTLEGGEGDDTLVVADALPFPLVFLGGEGTDTLALYGGAHAFGVDLSSAGVERLIVRGDVQLALDAAQHLQSLALTDTAKAVFSGNVLRVNALSIAPTATLDLGQGALILEGGSGLLNTLGTLLARGYNGGDWNGPGLTSSAAAANPLKTTGLAAIANQRGAAVLHASLAGEPLTATSILVKHTFNGDANLDGKIDADDYFRINRGQAQALTGYASGDFNYDKTIDLADYTLIDRTWLAQHSKSRPASALSSRAAVAPKRRPARPAPARRPKAPKHRR